MILVFGGAYQGKLEYVIKRFHLSEHDIYMCSCDKTDLPNGKRVLYRLDQWILAMVHINQEEQVQAKLRHFVLSNPECIVICNDISGGIVPTDPTLRKWRETVGRSLSVLAQESNEVVRLFCGLPTLLLSQKSCKQ